MLARDQEEIHEGDPDIVFRLRLFSKGRPVDLSVAERLTMVFERPNGSTFARTAQRTSSRLDGAMQYVTIGGELSPYGLWGVQGFARMPGESGLGKRTNIVRFRVYPNVQLEDTVTPDPVTFQLLVMPSTGTTEVFNVDVLLFQIIVLPPTLV
jgi:hypothetical protein